MEHVESLHDTVKLLTKICYLLKSLFQKFCHLDFNSLSFSEYLRDFAHFGVILFVEMSFIIF